MNRFWRQVIQQCPGAIPGKAGEASVALGNIGDRRAVEHSFKALEDNTSEVRRAAELALEKLGAQKQAEHPASDKLEYFEVVRPTGDGYCSDTECPCNDTAIPIVRGSALARREGRSG